MGQNSEDPNRIKEIVGFCETQLDAKRRCEPSQMRILSPVRLPFRHTGNPMKSRVYALSKRSRLILCHQLCRCWGMKRYPTESTEPDGNTRQSHAPSFAKVLHGRKHCAALSLLGCPALAKRSAAGRAVPIREGVRSPTFQCDVWVL